jgi:predicted DCC family thiol-disulfide oxidoreductase YuxK
MAERPTVYYNGGCPICSREISFYRRRPGGDSFAWVDVTQADEAALGPGLTCDAARARHAGSAMARQTACHPAFRRNG